MSHINGQCKSGLVGKVLIKPWVGVHDSVFIGVRVWINVIIHVHVNGVPWHRWTWFDSYHGVKEIYTWALLLQTWPTVQTVEMNTPVREKLS